MMVEHHYIYTGEGDPPEDATHVSLDKSITAVPHQLFLEHPNIIELICHIRVKKIERKAFGKCPRLKRLVMPGVEEIEWGAFFKCDAIEHVECDKLEIIEILAFSECKSVESIDLPSAKIVMDCAFDHCVLLTDVKFGKNLESIGENTFTNTSLNRITIPLKRSLFTHDDVFVGCEYLSQVCLIEDSTIQETVDALLLDDWKNDMNKEIDSIIQILPNAYAGHYQYGADETVNVGEKNKGDSGVDWASSTKDYPLQSRTLPLAILVSSFTRSCVTKWGCHR